MMRPRHAFEPSTAVLRPLTRLKPCAAARLRSRCERHALLRVRQRASLRPTLTPTPDPHAHAPAFALAGATLHVHSDAAPAQRCCRELRLRTLRGSSASTLQSCTVNRIHIPRPQQQRATDCSTAGVSACAWGQVGGGRPGRGPQVKTQQESQPSWFVHVPGACCGRGAGVWQDIGWA